MSTGEFNIFWILLILSIFPQDSETNVEEAMHGFNGNYERNKTIDEACSGKCEKSEWDKNLSYLYSEWSEWSKCPNGGHMASRERKCQVEEVCKNTSFREEKTCKRPKRKGRWQQLTVKYKTDKQFYVVLNNSSKYIKKLGVNLILPKKSVPRKRVYSKWSRWTICSKSCLTQRYRWCKKVELCGNEVLRQTAYCYTEGTECEAWIQSKIPLQEWNSDLSNLLDNGKDDTMTEVTISNELLHGGRGVQAAESSSEPACGIPISNATSYLSNMLRIIGGRPSQNGKWPWIVAVLNRHKEAICGGTLVSSKWVLTAAHCVKKRLYVTIGEYDLATLEGKELRLRVRKSIIHPEYDVETVDNDVALLLLPSHSSMQTYSKIACLPKPEQHLPTKRLCTIIGWGKQSSHDAYGSDILHEAQVPIVSNQACRVVYERYQTITQNMFCAGYRKGRMDTCAGDSGGPLLCKDSSGKWTIFGITSFGEGCGKRGKFGIYTKVPNYVTWIKSVIN